jgi:hypothetical protein
MAGNIRRFTGGVTVVLATSLSAVVAAPATEALGVARVPEPRTDVARVQPRGAALATGDAKAAKSGSWVRVSASGRRDGADFNGDGVADLAVGGWLNFEGPIGAVSVIYGSRRGLTATRAQLWSGADFGRSRGVVLFGGTLAAGDFDDDGFSDLAVGADDGIVGSGYPGPVTREVRIIYGSRQGLTKARSQVWTQNSNGVPGNSTGDDHFGSALAAADFGKGAQDDLAIGAAYKNGGRGAVTVLYGSTSGLTARGSQLWSQATAGIPGASRPGEYFGVSLAAGNFASRAYTDLAVGVPGDALSRSGFHVGAVNVIYGSASGLTAKGSQLWRQSSPGIKGKAAPEEQFGSALAAGHFAGRVAADLAIGARADTDADEVAGAVNVIYGSTRGLTAKGNQLWTKRAKGLADKRHLDYLLGEDPGVGNFGHDYGGRSYDDLAFSAYAHGDETGLGSHKVVEVLYGSSGGLAAAHSQSWRWASPGIRGSSKNEGAFGDSLAAANFGNNFGGRAYDDLVAADPFYFDEHIFGAVGVIYGSGAGLTAKRNQLWTVPDLHSSENFEFGLSVHAG